MTAYAPLAAIHGISAGNDDRVRPFAQPLQEALERLAGIDGRTAPPPLTPVLWASLVQSLPVELEDSTRRRVQSRCVLPGQGWLEIAFDYVRDVFVYATHPAMIKAHVRAQLAAIKQATGKAPVVYAHSLGSVILADILLDWLAGGEISHKKAIEDMPVRAVVTVGSPLGVEVPLLHRVGFVDRADGFKAFAAHWPKQLPWINLYDGDDPVVTGSLFGVRRGIGLRDAGYADVVTTDLEISTGFSVIGHVNYVSNAVVASTVSSLTYQG